MKIVVLSAMEVAMNNPKGKALASTLFLVGLTCGLANAQQLYPPKSEASPSPTDSSNSLTGGAEGTTTDKGTPGTLRMGGEKKNSLSGSSGSGNTLTGGAEGSPTDQGAGGSSGVKRPNGSTPMDRSRTSAPMPNEK
jgi:hypothetical protein